MSDLFVVKEKVIKYQFLALDMENPESLKRFSEITGKGVFRFIDIPDSTLITKRLVFELTEFNKYSQDDLVALIADKSEIKSDIQLYSVMTTDIWADPEDFEYYVGVAIRYKEV